MSMRTSSSQPALQFSSPQCAAVSPAGSPPAVHGTSELCLQLACGRVWLPSGVKPPHFPQPRDRAGRNCPCLQGSCLQPLEVAAKSSAAQLQAQGQAGSPCLCSARLHEGQPLKAAGAETRLDGAQQPLSNLIPGKPGRPDLCHRLHPCPQDAVRLACRSPTTLLLPAPGEQKGKENGGCLGRPRDGGRGRVLAEERGRDSPHTQPPSSTPLSACSRH